MLEIDVSLLATRSVYGVICEPRKELYIGQTNFLARRLTDHLNQVSKRRHVVTAWNQHSVKNFRCVSFESNVDPTVNLLLREVYWHELYDELAPSLEGYRLVSTCNYGWAELNALGLT